MSDPYTVVRLDTANERLVTRIKVPTMHPMPEVVVWGSRIFVRAGKPNRYREGLAWFARPDTQTDESTDG